jgi:hypothetical protein
VHGDTLGAWLIVKFPSLAAASTHALWPSDREEKAAHLAKARTQRDFLGALPASRPTHGSHHQEIE